MLIVAGIVIPLQALGNFDQGYIGLDARVSYRMADGGSDRRTRWAGKHRLSLSGSGRMPSGLLGIDFTSPVEISAPAPTAIADVSNVITVPATRRADSGYEPAGFAVVGDELVATTIGLVGDTATLGIVSGASSYQVMYWPKITADAVLEQSDVNSQAVYNWRLVAEET